MRVVAKGDTVLIVGEKSARRAAARNRRFIWSSAISAGLRAPFGSVPLRHRRARAHVADGELHISVPKIAERRGGTIEIAIKSRSRADGYQLVSYRHQRSLVAFAI